MTTLMTTLDSADYTKITSEREESNLIMKRKRKKSRRAVLSTIKQEELENLKILFEDVKKLPEKVPSLAADSKELQLLTSRSE